MIILTYKLKDLKRQELVNTEMLLAMGISPNPIIEIGKNSLHLKEENGMLEICATEPIVIIPKAANTFTIKFRR